MLKNLRKEMAGANITIEALAAAIHAHRNTVANKLDGSTKFTVSEAFLIRDKFFPNLGLEYLFQDDA